MHIRMLICETELFTFTAANAEMMDASVTEQIVAAAQNTGVAQFRSEIIGTQVCVSVKMNDMQIRITNGRSSHRAERYQMFSSYQQLHFPVIEYYFRTRLNIRQRAVRISEAEFNIAAVKESVIGQILVLIGTVSLKAETLFSYRRRAESCARTERRCLVERRAVQND